MARLLIKNGRVIDPASRHDGVADVWIEDGVIKGVGDGSREPRAQKSSTPQG